MKRILPAIFIFFTLNAFAQNANDWTTYSENDTVKIQWKYKNCIYSDHFDSEYVILEITNKINKELTIDWQGQLWYDDKCINCETVNEENRKQIIIPAASVTEGKCITNNSLRIFSKFTENLDKMPGVNKITALTKFELTNIKIK
tara:strand:+ start:407 stop:841 length:435 start_codon:yes stop_codon:yes gene_type:complete